MPNAVPPTAPTLPCAGTQGRPNGEGIALPALRALLDRALDADLNYAIELDEEARRAETRAEADRREAAKWPRKHYEHRYYIRAALAHDASAARSRLSAERIRARVDAMKQELL